MQHFGAVNLDLVERDQYLWVLDGGVCICILAAGVDLNLLHMDYGAQKVVSTKRFDLN